MNVSFCFILILHNEQFHLNLPTCYIMIVSFTPTSNLMLIDLVPDKLGSDRGTIQFCMNIKMAVIMIRISIIIIIMELSFFNQVFRRKTLVIK